MLPNCFIGRKTKPAEADVRNALGPAKATWDRLLTKLVAEKATDAQEWSSYSPKAGWSLKVKKGERTILYLSPCKQTFRASFALGETAIRAALSSGLPPVIQKLVREAKRYAEGAAVRLEVRTAADIESVLKLAAAKAAK